MLRPNEFPENIVEYAKKVSDFANAPSKLLAMLGTSDMPEPLNIANS